MCQPLRSLQVHGSCRIFFFLTRSEHILVHTEHTRRREKNSLLRQPTALGSPQRTGLVSFVPTGISWKPLPIFSRRRVLSNLVYVLDFISCLPRRRWSHVVFKYFCCIEAISITQIGRVILSSVTSSSGSSYSTSVTEYMVRSICPFVTAPYYMLRSSSWANCLDIVAFSHDALCTLCIAYTPSFLIRRGLDANANEKLHLLLTS